MPVNYGQTDAWALKIDTGLNMINSKIWGGRSIDVFADVISLKSNDILFYGYTSNPDTLTGNISVITSSIYRKLMLIKTDSNFNELWQKGYGCKVDNISQNNGSNSFIETLDHGFMMSAKANPFLCEPEPFDEGQSVFIKVDSTGKEVFTRYYGNKQICDVRSINETKDGSIVVYDMGIRDTNNICRRPDVYNSFWNVYQWSYGLNIGVEEKNNDNVALLVYPNPATNTITFETAVNKLQLQVYNISGQMLTDKQLQTGSNTLDVSNYPQGMYFYRLTDVDNYFKSGKFVKE